MCVCIWPAIDSVPGGHTDMRPVSLEPVEPEGVQCEKNFPEKWPVAKLPNKKYYATNAFLWEDFFSYFAVHFASSSL